jgi:lysophospholipase L1-like esterase
MWKRLAAVALTGVALAAPAGATAQGRPTAAVSLGDSGMSGESAGDYEPGTDRPGNFCHRSRDALIHRTAIPGIDVTLNLACSGATTTNLRIDGAPMNGEPPQLEKLRRVAATHEVETVVLSVGANDDPRFSDVARDCIVRFVVRSPGCRAGIEPAWPARLSAMAPKVARVLADVRAVLRDADPGDVPQLVLASYWSPVPAPPIRCRSYLSRLVNGAPLYDDDLAWAHDRAVPQLSAALRSVARTAGWRFLDLSRSMHGREVCARGITDGQEWVTGLRYNPSSAGWLSFDAVRETLHPNAAGHAQIGRCVTEFARRAEREARCLRGADGDLHAVV